jgi:hypothetical protein
MFAKVFSQIFDSSIAEDYNCRRMFMDLLVLADPTGAVDMTYEAIARRTNVPIEEVKKYIEELLKPDPSSRSKMSNGSRIVALDSHRDWGWLIVNYQFYRKIRDQEVRREYFRDAQRRSRAKRKSVKDGVLTTVDTVDKLGHLVTSPSSSSYISVLKDSVQSRFKEWIAVRKAMGKKPKDWDKMFSEQVEWLKDFNEADQLEILSASIRNNWQGLHPPKRDKKTDQKKEDPRQTRLDREFEEAKRKYG